MWTVDCRLWTIIRNFKLKFSATGIFADNHNVISDWYQNQSHDLELTVWAKAAFNRLVTV